ncbi:response regulator transcription factor [Salimicrobium halophilum]|uniref:DNA-binding response regulator, OmpR family, contains REC and winged-helix (WHTH) domain n=1 Tax=Salimicrobium halophilum TaxID=86666 RepID=A0A1G8S6E0_9BACI|nr:response regulator transcription factor [Salimicrobium halophilum]SDJ24789.1 DNA-binding response regulator, OmpR family, contains REC and winged-helix (wHTH) domain [Salimicrobium halophilum]
MTRILIIEDEQKIARVLELELTHEGYEVSKAYDGLEGLRLYREQEWDLILLDIMLPEMSGRDVLRRIRSGDEETPVIMLTAMGEVKDKVEGLDLGANDYVTKPFDMEELFARIRANLRPKNGSEAMRILDLEVNEVTHEVKRDGKLIDLTAKEFSLLAYLLKHKRQVMSREQLLVNVWGYDYYGDTNIVDVYIRYVRNKVDKPFGTPLIQTIRGVGYVMKEPT